MNLSDLFLLNLELSELPNLVLTYFYTFEKLVILTIISSLAILGLIQGIIKKSKRNIGSVILLSIISLEIFVMAFLIENDDKIFIINNNIQSGIHLLIYISLLFSSFAFFGTSINNIFYKKNLSVLKTILESIKLSVIFFVIPILFFGSIGFYVFFLFSKITPILPQYLNWLPIFLFPLPLFVIVYVLYLISKSSNLIITDTTSESYLEKTIDISKLKVGEYVLNITLNTTAKLNQELDEIRKSEIQEESGDSLNDEIDNFKSLFVMPKQKNIRDRIENLLKGKAINIKIDDSLSKINLESVLKSTNFQDSFYSIGTFTKSDNDKELKIVVDNPQDYLAYSLRLTKSGNKGNNNNNNNESNSIK